MRWGLGLLPLLCIAASWWARPATATEAGTAEGAAESQVEHRFAVIVGSNLGEPGEEPLEFAERDAARMAEVLTRLGGVPAPNMALLRGSKASEVEEALLDVSARIAARRASAPETKALVVLYYSGHADTSAMHLGLTKLPFSRAKDLMANAGAELAVIVVDACRSGGLTRVKGAVPAEPFEILADDQLDSTGLAIITSSSAGEDAQESDRLQSGIFTHHFLNGLLGAADASRDLRVTLSEAYRYAYHQTLRTTSRTRFVQHPTFSYQLQGRQELVLTRLHDTTGYGRLRLEPAGSYLLLEGESAGSVVAELGVDAGTDVLLVPGRYLVRKRGAVAVHEAQAEVRHGETTVVAEADMSRLPYGRTVRKGFAEESAIWSVAGGAEVGGPTASGLSVGAFGMVGAQADLEAVTLQARLRYGRANGEAGGLSLSQDMLGVDFGAYKVFDVAGGGGWNLGIGLGVRVGADWFYQTFSTEGVAPNRSQFVGRAAPVFRVEVSPAPSMAMALDCGADIYALEGESGGITTPVVPFCALGIGFYLP
jgi:hypothetical protein